MPNLDSRFSVAPSNVNMKRSTFDMPSTRLDTGNFGEILPFFVEEVLPGDTWETVTRLFSRMSTPLYPVMDNAWIDYYYFFVPNRLVWSRWAEFLGENKFSAWTQDVEYIIPHGSVRSSKGSVYDHMGIPTGSVTESDGNIVYGDSPLLDVNVLPMRAYHLIYNEWFRNENVTDPIIVNTGDDVTSEELERYQTVCHACKPFDQFTSALPAPQKGDAVDIPLTGNAVVMTSKEDLLDQNGIPMRLSAINFDGQPSLGGFGFLGYSTNQDDLSKENFPLRAYALDKNITNQGSVVAEPGGPTNLYADMSGVSAATINQLRQAFQMQRLLELQARTGTRLTEIIKASFGVTSPDARLQRPEYLGGSRVQIQMQQVTQTSGTTDESPLGKVGAYSKTVSVNRDFIHSFTEHGYLIGVAVARHALTYQQGLRRMWSRRGRYDFYWPTFANIGEQPIFRKELYATGFSSNDDKVFGYQEAWYEYRYKPNEVCGMFRSTLPGNLDEWHYGDVYTAPPLLSDGWMEANGTTVDRTLAVTSALHDQLLFNYRVECKVTRVMPLYSVPGLIDRF